MVSLISLVKRDFINSHNIIKSLKLTLKINKKENLFLIQIFYFIEKARNELKDHFLSFKHLLF